MTNTAAGPINPIKSARSNIRGGTTMHLGTLADGRFVVSSIFQWEIRTKFLAKAEAVFASLTEQKE